MPVRDDRKPERFEAGELETQLRFVEYLSDSMARKLALLTEDDVRRALVPSGTTLLWLVKHAATAQVLWLSHFFTGELTWAELPDADALDDETISTVTALLAAATRRTRAIVEALADPDALSVLDVPGHGRVSLRWVLAHLVEEIARHAGHADILRELTDGQTGR